MLIVAKMSYVFGYRFYVILASNILYFGMVNKINPIKTYNFYYVKIVVCYINTYKTLRSYIIIFLLDVYVIVHELTWYYWK